MTGPPQPKRLHIGPQHPSPPLARESGPGHYVEASRYAADSASALQADDVARAQALAAIGQIHATLAVAAATAPDDDRWREVTRR
jgi:hypothetical protein